MGTKHIKIVVRDGIDEGRLMKHLVYIIEGDRFHDQFPHRMDGAFIRSYVLDCHNDWLAALVRKGEKSSINEPPFESDTLCLWHRYKIEPLMAIKPWLEYLFSPKTNL
jgi:hypothetical protein